MSREPWGQPASINSVGSSFSALSQTRQGRQLSGAPRRRASVPTVEPRLRPARVRLSTFVHLCPPRGRGAGTEGQHPPPKRSLPASFPGGRPRNVAAEILRNALPAPAGHDVRFHFLFHLTLLPTIHGAAQYTWAVGHSSQLGRCEDQRRRVQGARHQACQASWTPPTPLPIPQCRCRCSSRTPTDLGAG